MNPMIRRAAATQACMDRFAGKAYAPGVRDCAKLAAHAMHKMGRRVSLLKGQRYTTEAGAVRVLRRTGFASLIEAVDALGLSRIAPAAALPADLVAIACDDGGAFGCSLTVALDNGRVLGFQNGVCLPAIPQGFICAWRV